MEGVRFMKLDKATENRIREQFHSQEFQDFMFKMICGESKDEDGIPYRQVYVHELLEAEDNLINMVDSFIKHNIPINRNCIISFILADIVDSLIGDDINCNTIKFFVMCNRLYYAIFHETSKYCQMGLKSKVTFYDEKFAEKEN